MACIFFLIASMPPQLSWVLRWKGLTPSKGNVGHLCWWILQNWGDSSGGGVRQGRGWERDGGQCWQEGRKGGLQAGRVHMQTKLWDKIQNCREVFKTKTFAIMEGGAPAIWMRNIARGKRDPGAFIFLVEGTGAQILGLGHRYMYTLLIWKTSEKMVKLLN